MKKGDPSDFSGGQKLPAPEVEGLERKERRFQKWHGLGNKDHQRMIVDPMFMIFQSLGSFLTTVTTTAVAPIAVILPEFS